MTIIEHVKEEVVDSHRADNNIVIDVEMTIRGEKFSQAIVLVDYIDHDRVKLRDEVINHMATVGRLLGGVVTGRDDLYEAQQ